MNQTIQNGISSLENLFAVNAFRIPQYQRAYSWEEEPHLEAFLEDLRQQVNTQTKFPEKHYFLGTLLLHEEDIGGGQQIVNIVDGQQRMTTSVVFIATALRLHAVRQLSFGSEKPSLLKRNFIYDQDTGQQKFHTIQEDEPFFQSAILGVSSATTTVDSPSSRRLRAASDYFGKKVLSAEWERLIAALRTAKVMVYAVVSAEDATQIFELQNDRGKKLTNLEALKSFLMHCVYLHSPKRAEDRLASIQTQFAKIFRTVESLAEKKRTPDEDQLLSNHCVSYLAWTEKEYSDPKHLVKATIKSLNGNGVIEWIEEFVSSLVESYRTVNDIFDRLDDLPEFCELLILGRMGSFWPLILKTWRYDQTPTKAAFLKTCRLLEVFVFRGYAVANLRADTSLSRFQTVARDFAGDFMSLFKHIAWMSRDHNLDARFADGLDNSYFYQSEGSDAVYLLWRYENHLRSRPGKTQPTLKWRDFVEPRSYAAKFSVEHVAARENPVSDSIMEWDAGDPKSFHEVALDRLGNLVIDSISTNASKGNKDFTDKLQRLSTDSSYLSQGELVSFTDLPTNPVWDVGAIRRRHKHLIEFALKTWDPDTWHHPQS